jgi:hypothetical protein
VYFTFNLEVRVFMITVTKLSVSLCVFVRPS